MVNTGKPSQGCGTCRARRIKCDERKPKCFRCQKSKRECTGYRDLDSLRMRWNRSSHSRPLSSPNNNSNPTDSVSPTSTTNSNSHELIRRSFSGSLPSSATASKLTFRISVSPCSGLSTPIEEQAKCLFLRNFVLEPCEGNSRSYMGFVIPVMEREERLCCNSASASTSSGNGYDTGIADRSRGGGGSRLAAAVMAASLALMGNRPSTRFLLPRAMKCYSKALKQINDALLDPELAVEDDTLAAVIVLGLFEVLTGTSGQPSGWFSHSDGAAILVKMRDQKKKNLSDLGRILHIMARNQLVVNCLVSCAPPILGVNWWMRFGTKDGLPTTCSYLNLSVACLHAKINTVLTSASLPLSTSSLEAVLSVLNQAKALETQFKEWEEALPPTWKYNIVAWIENIAPEKLEEAAAFPGRRDEYLDISIATALNMMRASRIMLAGDILRVSAWLCPRNQNYRIRPEYAAAVRTSRNLIEDIFASIPYFLGDSSSGERERRGRMGLMGKSALGLFITWPLMVAKMCDYATEAQRMWAAGRLRFIAEDMGIGQAAMFSNVNVRLPSMFIIRDEYARVDGKEVANRKCIDLVMSASEVSGKELEHMIAGLLGCRECKESS